MSEHVPTPASDATALERVMFEVKRVIVGQERLVERLVVSLLAQGHCLLEGVPGVAKTLAVETLARTVTGSFSRLQFTPDLVPSDIMGTRIYRAGSEQFETELGPIMANFVLADEINRAPAKVQSALLEVMAERHVTIGGRRYDVPNPFLVLATQNPIESEGVYPLPEAQRDRFLMKIVVDYPSAAEEREIIYRMGAAPPTANPVISTGELIRLQEAASRVFVHHAIVDYVVRLVLATRNPQQVGLPDVAQWISYGATPRASLGFIAAGLPLIGAGASIVTSLGVLLAFTYVTDIANTVINVVTAVGLGLSIDYGLLVVSRFREEYRAAAGRDSATTERLRKLYGRDHDEPAQHRAIRIAAVASALDHAGRTFAPPNEHAARAGETA